MAAPLPFNAVRDVLLCLLGHGGDVVSSVDSGGDPWATPRFAVNADVAGKLQPGTLSIAKGLVPLASDTLALSEFSTRHSSTFGAASLYVHALADGVEAELAAFRAVVLATEGRLLADPALPLSAVRHAVHPFVALHRSLAQFCARVEADALVGGQIINALVVEAQSGAPDRRAAYKRLLTRTQQVLFHQLVAWMVYGTLEDPTREFFVTGDPPDGTPAPDHDVRDPVVAEREWGYRFTVRPEVTPTRMLSAPVADLVLFVGKAVRLFRQHGTVAASAAPAGGGPLDDGVPHPLLDDDDEDAFLRDLSELKDTAAPSPLQVECCVDRLRATVATRLWRRLVVDAKLAAHLDALNNYFLLGRGELFQAYLDNVRGGAHEPYATAADVFGARKDPLFSRFELFQGVREFEYPARPLSDPPIVLVHADAAPKWHPHPVVVAEGFTTSFKVATTRRAPPSRHPAAASGSSGLLHLLADGDEDDAGVGFSLVLHTEGPLAAGDPSAFGRHDAVGNCLVVRFRLPGKGPGVKVSVLAGKRAPGGGCALQDRTVLAAGERTIPLSEDGTLSVTVEYTRAATRTSRGMLTVSSSPSAAAGRAARTPAIAYEASLRDVFTLRGVRGRAWVGFVGVQDGGPHAVSARLSRWHWMSTSRADEDSGGVGMQYHVEWPLHLVLTQASMDHYNELFRFLLRLRRVQSALHDAWVTLMASKASPAWVRLQPVWLLRSRMAFVVANLQYYLRQDVVEPAFARLKDTTLTSKDFWAVKRAHDTFINEVVQKSFLMKPAVSKAVSEILVECAALATLITRNEAALERCIQEDRALVQRIEKAFQSNANFLFDTQRASRVAAGGSLMPRMDFNGFFQRESLITL